ncbi:hypothetical protein OSTOST_04608, partial [Ostertagia ostertagi]
MQGFSAYAESGLHMYLVHVLSECMGFSTLTQQNSAHYVRPTFRWVPLPMTKAKDQPTNTVIQ